ncbi:MAG: hypothetical protein ACJATN_001693 [Neolewinella sp.]|jgi:hypothetical protein
MVENSNSPVFCREDRVLRDGKKEEIGLRVSYLYGVF